MKAKLLLIALLLLCGQTFAQRFEWAKGFAAGENVSVVGSVVDSVGNLYILASINFNTCWENGSRLLPIVPHDNAQDHGDAMIAKISPAGDLVWHKVIHGNYSNSIPHDIKLVGDSAFACLVTMPLATRTHYLYYLDTLINSTWHYGMYWDSTSFPDYPMSAEDSYDYAVLALINFDFNGNVQEQHFLQISYLDYNGDDIRYTHPAITNPLISNEKFKYPSFALDSEGNIYLSRWAYDMVSGGPVVGNYSVENGTISAVKFWCDRRVVGVAPSDSNLFLSPQILKFSPHFDTLLGSRYVFQGGINVFHSFYSNYLQTDKNNNLYLVDYVECSTPMESLLIIDSTKGESLYLRQLNLIKGFLIRYNPHMEVTDVISLEDSIINPSFLVANNAFYDIAFDYDSNLLFVNVATGRGVFGDTVNLGTILICQGIPLTSLKNDFFFMAFEMEEDSLKYHSYGRVNSKRASDHVQTGYYEHGNLVAKKNRIFMQSRNAGGVRFPTQNIEWPNSYDWNLGLTIFDYQGRVVGGQHYASFSPNNRVGSMALYDSTLYLINRLSSDATFGDIHVPSRGSYFACIAKYVDPMFMSTYERPRDTTVCVTVTQQELTVVRYPNPTTGRLTIDMQGRPLREAYVAAMDGIAEPLPVTPLGGDRYAADLTGRPSGTYILVLVADDQHVYNCHVILQH